MTLLTGGGRGAGLCGVGRGQARSAGGPAEGQRCQSWAPAHFPCPGETAADSGGHRLPQDCGEQKQLPLVKITTSRFPCQHQPLLRHSHDRPRTTPGSGEPPASGTEPRCQVSNSLLNRLRAPHPPLTPRTHRSTSVLAGLPRPRPFAFCSMVKPHGIRRPLSAGALLRPLLPWSIPAPHAQLNTD